MAQDKTELAWVRRVCRNIEMPGPAQKELERAARTQLPPQVWTVARGLGDPDRAEESWKKLKVLLEPDPDGWKMLFVQLSQTGVALDRLKRQGFEEQEGWDTLGAFSRFVREQLACGRCAFDRDFWTWRQTSGRIVRLGCLEYEPLEDRVMLHIPSGADLSAPALDASLARARVHWEEAPFCCESWLLSPALEALLPPDSRIRAFRGRFALESACPQGDEFVRWVFEGTSLPPAQWPERTRLQRAIKAHVRAGGSIGSGLGVLKETRR